MHVIALVSSVLIVVGCLLPWLQVGSVFQNRGIDNFDGAILLAAAVCTGALALYNHSQKLNLHTWVYNVGGILGLLIATIDIMDATSRAREAAEAAGEFIRYFGGDQEFSIFNFLGGGLYVVFFGSFGLIAVGFDLIGKLSANQRFPIVSQNSAPPIVAPENYVEDKSEDTNKPEIDPVERQNLEYGKKVESLHRLILSEKKAFLGSKHKSEIIILLNELCENKSKSTYLLKVYKEAFGKELIESLKSLTSSYDVTKEYLAIFIRMEIVIAEYPHDLL